MTESKDPRDVVWAVCDGIPHAGQMTRAMLATSDGWKEVDESHPKVLAAVHQPPALVQQLSPAKPDRAASKEK